MIAVLLIALGTTKALPDHTQVVRIERKLARFFSCNHG